MSLHAKGHRGTRRALCAPARIMSHESRITSETNTRHGLYSTYYLQHLYTTSQLPAIVPYSTRVFIFHFLSQRPGHRYQPRLSDCPRTRHCGIISELNRFVIFLLLRCIYCDTITHAWRLSFLSDAGTIPYRTEGSKFVATNAPFYAWPLLSAGRDRAGAQNMGDMSE